MSTPNPIKQISLIKHTCILYTNYHGSGYFLTLYRVIYIYFSVQVSQIHVKFIVTDAIREAVSMFHIATGTVSYISTQFLDRRRLHVTHTVPYFHTIDTITFNISLFVLKVPLACLKKKMKMSKMGVSGLP